MEVNFYPKGTAPTYPITFEDEMPLSILPEAVVDQRAQEYDQAMTDKGSPGASYYKDKIWQNQETLEQTKAAERARLQKRAERQALLTEFFNQRDPSQPLTPEDLATIEGITDERIIQSQTNPETFFSKEYGKYVADKIPLEGEPPAAAQAFRDGAADTIAHTKYAQRVLEEAEAEWAQAGPGSTALAYVKEFIPFHTWSNLSQALEGVPAVSFLPGNNVEEQRTWFYGTPLDVSGPAFKKAFKEMYASNPLAAIHYAQAMVSYGPGDKWADNYLLGGGDISMLAPGIGLIPMSTTKLAIKTALRGVSLRTTRRSTVVRAVGDVERATWMDALNEVGRMAATTGQFESFDELFGRAFTMYDIEGVTMPPGIMLTPESVRRIAANMYKRSAALTQTLIDPILIERLKGSSQAWEAAQRAAREDFIIEYPTTADAIMNTVPVNSPTTLAGVDAIAIQVGRQSDALPFAKQGAATNAARNWYKFPENSYEIKTTDGKNWFIEVIKNVDETKPKVRSLLIETNNQTPQNLFNTFLGFLRSPNYLVSPEIMSAMHVATHGSAYLIDLTKDVARSIGGLSSKGRADLEGFLIWQRDVIYKGERGAWSDNLSHFEQDWHYKFNRLPTEAEADAYMAFRQLHDYDFVVRNLGIYRDKVRQGLEDFILSYHADLPSVSGQKLINKAVDTPGLEGKIHHEMPWQELTDWNYGILILDPNNIKDSKQFWSKFTNKATRETIDSYWKKRGYVIVELTDYGEKALRGSPGMEALNDIDITILLVPANSQKARPLKFQQIPYKAGPRVENAAGFYLAQPRLRRVMDRGTVAQTRYSGDINVAFQQTETDANRVAAAWNKANQLFLEGNEAALEAHLARTLPFSAKEFKAMMKTEANPNGFIDPSEQILVRKSDQSLATAHNLNQRYANFVDTRDGPLNRYKTVNLENATERGHNLRSVVNIGSAEAPVWRFEPAKLVDPLAAMERSTSGILQARQLDNLKVMAAERWVKEFGDLIDGATEAEIWADPLKYLFDFKPKPGADSGRLAAAKNLRRTVLDFLGLKNDVQKKVDWLKQKLADKVFEKFGRGTFEVVEPYLLRTVADPARRMRSFAFHTKLGLFNPVQLFLQMQTMAHMAGIEGAPRTIQASAGATFMAFLKHGDDPKSVALAAKRATAFGWKEKDFIEAYEAMKKSGVSIVSGEYAARDDLMEPKIFSSRWGNFLDKGTFFFTKGERGLRLSAWNAAYLRWRQANPGKVFGNQDKIAVLSRANLLFGDMTRASNAMWQRGFASVPTQFLAYPVRIAEQFLGKRLTLEEKMWALFTYSTIYGMPVALNAPTGVWDWSEDIRRYMLENNIDYDESVMKVFMDGVVSVGLEAMTGTKYNYPERYGINNPWLREFVEGKKDWKEMVFGVSGSIYNSAVTGGNPFIKRFYSLFDGTSAQVYPLTYQDWLAEASEISSINNFRNSWNAITAGKYYTRHGEYIDDVTPIDGLFQGFMGLTPQSTDDLFTLTAVMKNMNARQAEERKQAIINLQAGFKADDQESRDIFFTKADVHMQAGEFTEREKAGILQDAFKGHEARFYSIHEQWMSTSPEAQEAYAREQRKRQQRFEKGNQ